MSRIIFRQLFEKVSSTYTYILACPVTKTAIIIDPVVETADRDALMVNQLGLNLIYAINTHCHADHITGTGKLKTLFPDCKSMISATSGADADVKLSPEERVDFGSRYITTLATPGHTDGCMSFLLDDSSMVFTGDTLHIRGCGRTDFQAGDSALLYQSVHSKLFTLPDDCMVYPAHDYNGRCMSTVGEEKAFNPRLTKSKEEFIDIMANLGLSYPAQIDRALPANMKCGLDDIV
ncbi:ETHE1 [Symbiodinium microadriaticum]|nr:ETHE1 [Symbiodinium microadriaticum]